MERISAYHRAMAAIIHTGGARYHNSYPSTTLYLHRMYGTPVLLSGLASLYLSPKELEAISKQYKSMLCRLQKLPDNTPDSVIYFLARQLPSSALIHLKQLSLLGMSSRLGYSSILQDIGVKVLSSQNVVKKSWFIQINMVCCKYGLPEALSILRCPPTRESWKRLCRSKIVSWWELKLRNDACKLPSLMYFKPCYMSLTTTHPIW